jgi:hypothetical protein
MVLTSQVLTLIHEEVRFTNFIYDGQRIESGLLLSWMPDSILIQQRGIDRPKKISTSGLTRIETTVGNKMPEGLAVGTLAAAAYFLAIGGHNLSDVTFGEALAKLLVPPAMIIAGMAVGSTLDKRESYIVPVGFEYNHELAKSVIKTREP